MATEADEQLVPAYLPAFRDRDAAWWKQHIEGDRRRGCSIPESPVSGAAFRPHDDLHAAGRVVTPAGWISSRVAGERPHLEPPERIGRILDRIGTTDEGRRQTRTDPMLAG